MTTIAIISSNAYSLVNFRGPIIRTLVAANVRVLALAPNYGDATREQVRSLGAEPIDYSLRRTGLNPFRDVRDVVGLGRLLRRLRPDLMFCYTVKPVIYGILAAWLARVPRRFAMVTGLGYVFTDSEGKLSLKRAMLRRIVVQLYRFALTRAHRVVFQNEDDLKQFVELDIVNSSKAVCFGGTGIVLEDWPVVAPVTEPITFALAARLLREKGIVEYVEAAKRVKSIYPNVRFFLLGGLDSNPGSLTKSEVEGWVQEGIIEWPGHVDVRPWMKETSVYVLPSYREGVPRSTQEAMAMGRPIITTNAPGCRETVTNGQNGFLIPIRDVSALEEAMIRFINQPGIIGVMGARSREMAEERFNVHMINEKIMRVFGIEATG